MCLAREEFVGDEGNDPPKPVTDIAWIERTPAGLRVTGLFGETAEIEAEIRSIDFMESVVSVERRDRKPVK